MLQHLLSWCSVYRVGNWSDPWTKTYSGIFRFSQRQEYNNGSPGGEARRQTHKYHLARISTSSASQQSHIVHEPHGRSSSINQRLPQRPPEIRAETQKFPLPQASSSPREASEEVELPTELQRFQGLLSAFLAQEVKPQRIYKKKTKNNLLAE